MSVSKINFNGSNEAYIVVEPISDIDSFSEITHIKHLLKKLMFYPACSMQQKKISF